jgi:hypothetical protein
MFNVIFSQQILERALWGRDAHRSFWNRRGSPDTDAVAALLPALSRQIRTIVRRVPDTCSGLRLILPMLAAWSRPRRAKNIHSCFLSCRSGVVRSLCQARRRVRLIDWFYIGLALVCRGRH